MLASSVICVMSVLGKFFARMNIGNEIGRSVVVSREPRIRMTGVKQQER